MSGYGWRVEKSVAWQEGGDRVAAGEGGEVVVGEIGAVVHGRRPQLDRETNAGPETKLITVYAQPETSVAAGLEHRSRLVGVERALLAEDVDPARVGPARVEHLAADQRHVVVRAAVVLAKYRVRSQEGHVVGQSGGHSARPVPASGSSLCRI